MKKILIILLCFTFLSCVDEVDPDQLLDTKQKVFIYCLISPSDNVINVSVTRTLSIFKTELSEAELDPSVNPFLIKNAEVMISNENGNEINLPYLENELAYQVDASEFEIKGGEKYFLKVLVDGQEFTSTCTIPSNKVDATTVTEKLSILTGEGYENTILDLKFEDVVNEKNFYIVGAKSITDNNEDYVYNFNFYYNTFLNDAIGDGNTISTTGELYFSINNEEDFNLLLQVANVEEIVYYYIRSSFYNNYVNFDTGDSPLSEYSIPPDNIEGENGVGVFGGYQLTEKLIPLQ